MNVSIATRSGTNQFHGSLIEYFRNTAMNTNEFYALNHANFRKLGSTSVGSASILSPNFGAACCQTQSTATSTAIVSNGEAYRVVQFVPRAVF